MCALQVLLLLLLLFIIIIIINIICPKSLDKPQINACSYDSKLTVDEDILDL